ncbi:phosphotransferase family protein [Sporolactobacillus sp. CPB3-1]|uniref:Phosphotransferase family protein n=1 Tax=Sporolactobacillus mangiferae TaxID=2940498 RepID=A0ABT0M717_9BACL|nr:phosphotransferase family protein [Sporolactobacillus mangiferae]MCL1630651.1 phosphotransferase family protein [Sporolactobacillus mangiferae]
MARSGENRLFIKRNSSPFLAVLSAEGIVPKLLWTRRMDNGDVLTAQKWMKGRVLMPKEMASEQVAALLKKIHTSEPLVSMLRRLGKKPITTTQILEQLEQQAQGRHETRALKQALHLLKDTAELAEYPKKMVCHSDINHNNWLLSHDEKNLYLVDWDQAVIADPAMDLAMLLYWYVEEAQWADWLDHYGLQFTQTLRLRLVWHMIAMTLRFMFWHQEHAEMKKMILFEKDLLWLHEYAARTLH